MPGFAARAWTAVGVAAAAAAGVAMVAHRQLLRQPRQWDGPAGLGELLGPPLAAAAAALLALSLLDRAAASAGWDRARARWLGVALLLPLAVGLVRVLGLGWPALGRSGLALGLCVAGFGLSGWWLRRRVTPPESPAVVPLGIAVGLVTLSSIGLLAAQRHRPRYDLRSFPRLARGVAGLRPGYARLDHHQAIFAPILPLPGRLELATEIGPGSYLRLRLAVPETAAGGARAALLVVAGDGRELASIEVVEGARDEAVETRLVRLSDAPGPATVELRGSGSAEFLLLPTVEVLPDPTRPPRALLDPGDAARGIAPASVDAGSWWKVRSDADTRNAALLRVGEKRCVELVDRATRDHFDVALVEGMANAEAGVELELLDAEGAALGRVAAGLGQRGWQRLDIPGPKAAGATLCVRVTGDPALGWSVALADPLPATDGRRRSPPTNVVLVSLDTVRADVVGAYGGAADTPAFDALAARGVLFEQVTSAASWTLPAHASLFSGQLPSHHGAWGRDDVERRRLPAGVPLLAERLRAAGWVTLAATGGGYVDARFGFARGFDRYVDAEAARGFKDVPEVLRQVERLLDDAAEPFFLFAHTYAAHEPYGAVPPPPGEYEGDPGRARALYLEGVALADRLVAGVVASLARRGLEDRTLIVVTSDHGEEFADHDPTRFVGGHAHSVYDEVVRVPLLLAGPAVVAGRRHAAPVSLCDVAPTLLAVLGLEPLADADGVDLGPALAGVAAAPRVVIAEQAWGVTQERKSARLGALKLIRQLRPAAPDLLFDIDADPGERSPLPIRAATIAPLARELAGLEVDPPAVDGAAPAADPELLEELRALGYLQ